MIRKFHVAGLALAGLFLAPFAEAQTAPAPAQTAPAPAVQAAPAKVQAHPALWVVKDEDTTIYLFGTIHVLKPEIVWFDGGIKKAFDASDEVVLELIEPSPEAMQALILKTGINSSGPSLTEQLPEDRRAAYAAVLAKLGMAPAALDRLDPWLAAVTLTVAPLTKLGYDPESGAEKVITAAARAADKQLVGLETAEQQIGYFDTLQQKLQIDYLLTLVKDFDRMGPMLDRMVGYWAAGDPVALGKALNEDMRETPELAKVLLADRNARWADWIDARLKQPGTVFIAVGAGHLAGADSVQVFLAKHHLKAERVQ